jgi:NAD(P)-dependent dehydrogenase (short-subunit alcohol dehydrogenase family)
MLVGRDAEKGDAAVAELKAAGADARFVSLDLQDVEACLGLVDTAVGAFTTVNALVNAAALGARGALTDTSVALWDQMFDTNARAPFFLMQNFVKHRLSQGGGGSIVNILSQCAHCGQSYLAPYSASKGALATLTKNVANAHRFDRIRCNAILPGWMDTPGEDVTQRKYHAATDGWLERAEASQPMGQLCKPHELAGLASYLLSTQAGVMTGALIDYDQNIAGSYPE